LNAPTALAKGSAGHCSERQRTRRASPQSCTARSMVKIIDVVCNHRAREDFHHDGDSAFRLATPRRPRACGPRAKKWPSAPGCAGTQFRKWETSSDSIPAATYSQLCRVVDVLESEGARFSGDGVSALSGDSPDYLMEAVPPSINSNDSKGLHFAARARHAGVSHARHEQESQSARVFMVRR
jgi:hypothetical protein